MCFVSADRKSLRRREIGGGWRYLSKFRSIFIFKFQEPKSKQLSDNLNKHLPHFGLSREKSTATTTTTSTM